MWVIFSMTRNVSLCYLIMLNSIRYTISISSIFQPIFSSKIFWMPCRTLEIKSGRSIHQYWKHCSMWGRCRGIIPPCPKGAGSSVWIWGSGCEFPLLLSPLPLLCGALRGRGEDKSQQLSLGSVSSPGELTATVLGACSHLGTTASFKEPS